MSIELSKKTCRMCCMEIPAQARKCPHCQHFQNRLSMIMFHPGLAVLFVGIAMLIYLTVLGSVLDRGENFQTYKDQIQIMESELAFGDTKSASTIAVMGTITNTSSVDWEKIQFQAEFFDANGKRADVGQKEEYSFFLPARSATPFKVSFRREFPETNYVKHIVRVLSAKDARAMW